jgi:hypothetical protein
MYGNDTYKKNFPNADNENFEQLSSFIIDKVTLTG